MALGVMVITSNQGADICAAAADPSEFAGVDLVVDHAGTLHAALHCDQRVGGCPPSMAY